ncbi:alcohol dehydrogenase GroES-like domain protein, partial [Vibrio parahaemolyticus AQ3810]
LRVLMALTLSTSCLMKRYCYLSQTECRLRRRH